MIGIEPVFQIQSLRYFKGYGVVPMSTLHHLLSKAVQRCLVTGGLLLIFLCASNLQLHAAEVVMHTDAILFNAPGMSGGSCDCGGTSQPPWHGSVGGRCCNRPCCPPPTMFHADACGQLRAKDEAKAHCVELPSSFPRFNDWRHTGRLPSPRPIAMPRCHHCGMPIHMGM